jgi:DNA-binding CsgD family transcriptional regulator
MKSNGTNGNGKVPPRRKGLTPRERQIIKARVEGKSLRAIAKEVGTSNPRVFQVLQRVQPELVNALRKANYGLSEAVAKMKEMTDAKETKFFQHEGMVTDHRTVRDNGTCLEARKTMLQLHGVLGRRADTDGDSVNHTQIIIQNVIERPVRGEARD